MSLLAQATRGRKGIDQEQMSEYASTYIPLENHQTWTGNAISPGDYALNIVTVYQCVRILAETFASLPLIVYRRLPGGGKERATDHPWYEVLHGRPNTDMTSFVWRELLMSHLATWGNGYNQITSDGLGRPQLWPVRPDRLRPSYEDGVKVYDYIRASGEKQRMKPGTIFHVPGLSASGLVGYSPIALMRSTLGLLRTAESYGTNFFRNGARPAMVMSHPKLLSPTGVERLRTQMDELRGAGNSGKTVVLEEGTTLQEVGIPPEDAQYMETRLFQKREIAGAYRIPLHKLGDLEHATFTNIEHQSLEFITDTMMPWLVRVEQQVNIDLIADDEYFAEFLVDGYLRGDSKGRAEAFAIRWQHGTVNGDEWRAAENENPLPDGMGKEYFVPANYVPISKALASDAVEEGAPSDLMGTTAPQLTVIKSMGKFDCPDCGKLINRLAAPGTVGFCRSCKAEKTLAGQTPDTEPWWTGLPEAISALIPAQTAPVVNVHEPAEAPVIPAPIVNVEKADAPVVHVHTDSFVDAIADLKSMLERPREIRKTVVRDPSGRITGLVEEEV